MRGVILQSGPGRCKSVIYKKEYIFGLPPHFWQGGTKTLGIAKVMRGTKVSYVTEVSLGPHLKMGPVAGRTNHTFGGGEYRGWR